MHITYGNCINLVTYIMQFDDKISIVFCLPSMSIFE